MNDNLPLNKLNDVNWDLVSEEEAAHFGIMLGDFNDSIDAKEKLQMNLMHKMHFIMAVALIALLSHFFFDIKTMYVMTVVYLTFDIIRSLLRIRSTNSSIERASKNLSDVLDSLPQLPHQ